MFLNKNSVGRKALSIMLAAAMVTSVAVTSVVTSGAATTDTQTAKAVSTATKSSANQYGLKDNIQDGVILHAWQWSFNNIKSRLPQIAEAGYTAVQTSVVQRSKEATAGKTNEVWWLYYQPAAFEIDDTGNSALGTKADLEALCTEAEEYGIKIIVDVVANHLGNASGYDKSSAIPSDIKDDSSCWHDLWNQEIDYSNRYSITHGSMGGLPDLNSENTKVQNYVINFLKECIDVGVDGFRFDAAKHISVPDEGSQYTFWPNVLNATTTYASSKGVTPYYYGEALGSTTEGGGPAATSYTKYMSLTDDSTGNGIRGSVADGNASGASKSTYDKGIAANKAVLWAESHDTYSNESKSSTYVSDSNINKTWAMVGSRNGATALYFARTNGYRGGTIGEVYSTQCFNKEVAEVNKFHNYYAGQSEYLAYSGSIAYNERGTDGVVLVNCGGTSASVSVKANKMADGTYKDQVSGNTFTVSGGTISGQIGSTGIAVVYNAVPASGVSATPGTENGTYKYKSDTLTVTLNATNVTNATYSIDGGSATSFTDGTKITMGSGKAYETTQKLTITATNSSGSTVTKTYTFYKTNQGTTIYFDNSSYNWSDVYAYIYTGDGETAQSVAAWPGVQLTNKSTKSGYYYYDLPDGFEDALVIWSDGTDTASKRYPADMEPGLDIAGTSHLFTSGNTWKEYSEVVDPTTPTTATTATTPTTATSSGETYVRGDANGDGKVNMKDCILIQKATVGTATLSGKNKLAADVDSNSAVALADVVNIMRYLVGYTNTYNIGSVVGGEIPTTPTATTPTATTPTTPTATTPTPTTPVSENIVYFNDAAIAVGNERYALYVWDGAGGEAWVDMTSAGTNLYQATLPSGYTNYIVVRMDGSSTTNSWDNKWNQSPDLTYSSSTNLVTATGWGSNGLFNVSQSANSNSGGGGGNDNPIGDSVVYFNDAAIAVGNERYALYVWDGAGGEAWVDMTSAGSNLYQATLPSGYTNYIVVRMDGSSTTNSWDNKWNQSPDLTYSSSTNLVTATGWGSDGSFTVSQSAK